MHWKACAIKLTQRNPVWTGVMKYSNASSRASATRTFANLCQQCMHTRTISKTHQPWKRSDLPHSNTYGHVVHIERRPHSSQTTKTVNRCSHCNNDRFLNPTLCLLQPTIRHLHRIQLPHQCWFNLCPVNESQNPLIKRRRIRIHSTIGRALHVNNTVTSHETAPTGTAPRYFGKATNKSIR